MVTKHPAKFSDDIIRLMGDLMVNLPGQQKTILDPFSGTGKCFEWEYIGFEVTGVEIESDWITNHPRHVLADFIAWGQHYSEEVSHGWKERWDFIATSPTYGNRMADKHNARDDSVRHTYRHYLGHDLSDNNSGGLQWGPRYRAFHEAAWKLCAYILKPGGYLLLNIKDHIRQGERQGVPDWHRRTLMGCGLVLVDCVTIETPGLRHGDNAQTRVDHEIIYVFRKPDDRKAYDGNPY